MNRRTVLQSGLGAIVAAAVGMPALRTKAARETHTETFLLSPPPLVGQQTVGQVGPSTSPVDPVRILDTRTGHGYPFGGQPQPTQRFVVAPEIFGCVGLYLNVTVTDTTGPGFITVWSGVGDPPDASAVNWWGPGQILSNMILCPCGDRGGFGVYVSPQSATHVVIDLMGTVTNA